MKRPLCLINGHVFTQTEEAPWAEAVLTEGSTIRYVGDTRTARTMAGSRAEVIDLAGRLLLPGFIDNHTHLLEGGFHLQGIDLRPCRSRGAFVKVLQEYVSRHPGTWVTGGDWDEHSWETAQLPCREWIDEVTGSTPVFVRRFDGHMALANSTALEQAGISRTTDSPPGGVIDRDPESGAPTGILRDAAMDLVSSVVPAQDDDAYDRALGAALEHAGRNGITSIHDITLRPDLAAFQRREERGGLSCRVFARLPLSEYDWCIRNGIRAGSGSEMLRLGSLKAFADGSLGSRTALFFEPYADDPSTSGLAMEVLTSGRLRTWALEADRHHLQLSIHAIGDRAIDSVLTLFEEIVAVNPRWDRRFRIEHAQHLRQEDLARFRALGVIVSAQPYHAVDDGVWAERRIGSKRLAGAFPFRTYMDAGVHVCFGSDWTVAPLTAIAGIHAAVTRRTLDGNHPEGWIPSEKISVAQAVGAYTVEGAYASFEEDVKGRIAPGYLADLVVLDRDLFAIEPAEIIQARVQMTVVGGEVVFLA
jgi:predicted amidohydrolase YtcJ